MKTKPKAKVRQLREILGQTQTEFAAIIGVSKDAVASWDCGRNPLSPSLARRIALATGVEEGSLMRAEGPLQTLALPRRPFTRAEFEAHQKGFWGGNTEANARRHAQRCQETLELLFVAAQREGPGRVNGLLASFVQWSHEAREQFELAEAVDAQLGERPRPFTLTKSYGQWRELKKTDPRLARMMGFQDDPKKGDEVTLELTVEMHPIWQPGQDMRGRR